MDFYIVPQSAEYKRDQESVIISGEYKIDTIVIKANTTTYFSLHRIAAAIKAAIASIESGEAHK